MSFNNDSFTSVKCQFKCIRVYFEKINWIKQKDDPGWVKKLTFLVPTGNGRCSTAPEERHTFTRPLYSTPTVVPGTPAALLRLVWYLLLPLLQSLLLLPQHGPHLQTQTCLALWYLSPIGPAWGWVKAICGCENQTLCQCAFVSKHKNPWWYCFTLMCPELTLNKPWT